MRGPGGAPGSGIFERLTPTVGVTFLRVGVTLGSGWGRREGEWYSGVRPSGEGRRRQWGE